MRKLATILSLVLAIDALACRFNVRDVGFVDLGSDPYRLYIFVPENTPRADLEIIQSTAYATYLESNIKFEIQTPAKAADGEAKAFLPKEVAEPMGVFVSGDGKRSVPVKLTVKGQPLAVSIWDGLESVFDSPRRNAVLAKVYEHYGVILVVEGKNAAENDRIKKQAARVVATITARMDRLEKEIKEAPVVEGIAGKDFAAEKTFLWSLGVDAIAETPQVVVLYGRGRQMGPVLRDERLDEHSLTAIVNTIGLNCECGLDRKWMQGTMIPQSWDEDVRKHFADHLGFDPESPAIRVEMSQILAKGGKGQGANRNAQIGGTLDELLMGYREGALKIAEATSTNAAPKKTVSAPAPEKKAPPSSPAVESKTGYSIVGWMIMAGVPILIGGVIILLLGRRSNS